MLGAVSGASETMKKRENQVPQGAFMLLGYIDNKYIL
jgi:hypothetical protein